MDRKRYRDIQKVQFIIIILNITVSLGKLFYGYIINSASMTADGVHSMSDGLNNVIGIIGIYFAYKPIDEKHPYGHRKFETLTTLIISVLLFSTSLNILKSAFSRIIKPVIPIVTPESYLVMIVTIVINIFVTTYEKRKGKELKSEFLISDAAHTLSDVFVSLSVLVTLVAIKLGYIWVDTFVSIIISLLIIKSALDILKRGTDILCDAKVIDPEKISEVVCTFSEVYSCHKIRSHGLEDDTHVDLHVVANNNMNLENAHTLSHDIEETIKSAFPGVTNVNIHIEPQN